MTAADWSYFLTGVAFGAGLYGFFYFGRILLERAWDAHQRGIDRVLADAAAVRHGLQLVEDTRITQRFEPTEADRLLKATPYPRKNR